MIPYFFLIFVRNTVRFPEDDQITASAFNTSLFVNTGGIEIFCITRCKKEELEPNVVANMETVQQLY